jgi:hypothetical protein
MRRPPLPVIVISALLILAGVAELVGDFMNHYPLSASHYETVWIAGVHVLAIVAGVFMLRGHNWARWLAIAWMAFHVAISFGHSMQVLIPHAILLVLFAYGLFRADARDYFRPGSPAA